MTTVPPRPPIPKGRGKRHNPRTYSLWEWTRAYLVLAMLLPLFPVMYILSGRTLPERVTAKLLRMHRGFTASRPMDFRIPPDAKIPVYMERWWRLPRNWALNIYYHIVRRSDDDRALHDHPWFSFSIVLDGGYYEHEIKEGGINTHTWYGPGAMRFRWHGKKAHRLELEKYGRDGDEKPATTIFITGPVLRRWGFHHQTQWVDAYDWDAFCEANGIDSMKMDGGSDAVVSARNKLNPANYRKD